MSVTLPPPLAPEHPRPWWCPRCGQLEAAGCNHPLGGPSGPPPLPRGRTWDAARRRRQALTALANVTTPKSTR